MKKYILWLKKNKSLYVFTKLKFAVTFYEQLSKEAIFHTNVFK